MNKMILSGFILICALSYGSFSRSIQAHGDEVTHSMESGDYVIEFEYAAIGEVIAGSAFSYTLRLLDHESQEPKPFSSLEVKIASKDNTALLAHLVPSSGSRGLVSFITILPEAGDYTVILNFSDNEKVIASGQTTFKVIGQETENRSGLPIQGSRGWGIVVVAAIVGLLAGLLIPRNKT